jgi:uncharacterized protein
VLDTNVIVSALAYPRSKPRIALDKALSKAVVLASADTLGEFARVLGRKKMRRYLDADEATAFLASYSQKIVPIVVISTRNRSRGADDDVFVNLAIDGAADCLVTGDRDLLVLGSIERTRIVTPAVFLEAIGSSATPRT